MTDGTEEGALRAIIAGDVAWSRWEDLEREHGPAALDGLVNGGWVDAWILADHVALTLTPWGAGRLGVVIVESGHDEVPRWGAPHQASGPVWVRREPGELPLLNAAAVPDRGLEVEYLLDPADNEPLRLFGMKVTRDRRIRPAAAGRSGVPTKRRSAAPVPRPARNAFDLTELRGRLSAPG